MRLVIVGVLVLGLVGCGSPAGDAPVDAHPELRRAVRIVRGAAGSDELLATGFDLVAEECVPSEFVDFYFSTLGTRHWPPIAGGLEFPETAGQTHLGLELQRPADVAFVAEEVDVDRGRQIVVSGDDARGVIRVTGYVDPDDEPALVEEWTFAGLP